MRSYKGAHTPPSLTHSQECPCAAVARTLACMSMRRRPSHTHERVHALLPAGLHTVTVASARSGGGRRG
eukprot:363549-Chlamydomonas_euryale.AAC.4